LIKNIKKVKQYLKSYVRLDNNLCALCARRKRAMNTLQQRLARCRSVMDAIKTMWERRMDAVGTL